MITVKKLLKSFDDKEILKGVDLEVEEGEVVVILGPSGSGKTTFLRCLIFLKKADSGTMVFDDLEIDFKNVSQNDVSKVRKNSSIGISKLCPLFK